MYVYIQCERYSTCVSISLSPVPVVAVMITPSGSTVVGMSYILTCTVSGADNLEEAISIEFTGPTPNLGSGTGTSLQLPLTLDLTDAGRYTCTATVSSGLITSDIVSSDIEDITLQSECNSEVLQNSLCKGCVDKVELYS